MCCCVPTTLVILIIGHFICFFTHSAKPYRDDLVTKGAVSTESPTSPESIQHHEAVKELCDRISKADAKEYSSDHPDNQKLSCIYSTYRVDGNADADADADLSHDHHNDEFAAMIMRKIGKVLSAVKSLKQYWYNRPTRRNPFKYNDKDDVHPDVIEGDILCFVEQEGTLFDKSKFDDLANYLLEFIEVFVTAALCPTITICPSIRHLGDAGFGKDDPRFFATVQKIVHLIHNGKFELAHGTQVRNELGKYTDDEWDELITLTTWYYNNCQTPHSSGELSPNRAEHLEQIGFFGIVKRNQSQARALRGQAKLTGWMDTFNNVRNHAIQYGFKDWEETEGGETLYKWCRMQRNKLKSGGDRVKTAKLQEKNQWRIDVLNSIGFPWTGEWS